MDFKCFQEVAPSSWLQSIPDVIIGEQTHPSSDSTWLTPPSLPHSPRQRVHTCTSIYIYAEVLIYTTLHSNSPSTAQQREKLLTLQSSREMNLMTHTRVFKPFRQGLESKESTIYSALSKVLLLQNRAHALKIDSHCHADKINLSTTTVKSLVTSLK